MKSEKKEKSEDRSDRNQIEIRLDPRDIGFDYNQIEISYLCRPGLGEERQKLLARDRYHPAVF
jgi:hypothetical protein